MLEFDRRWKALTRRARLAPPREEGAPFGFSTRVLARAWAKEHSGVAADVAWRRLSRGSLAVVYAVLVICAVMEWPHFRDRRPLDPGIENTVAQLVWAL